MRRLPAGALAALLLLPLLPLREGLHTARIFFARDLSSYFWPHLLWLRTAAAQGYPPLWDPHPGLGYAVGADPALQIFFLPTLPLRLLLPAALGFNLSVALPYPVAALGLALLLRRSLSAPAAALGGLAYALSGPLLSAGNCTNLAWSAALTPWLLLATARLAARPGAARLAAAAAAAALLFLAGEPVAFAAAAALAVGWALLGASALGRAARARATLATLLALALGLALAAVQLAPLAEQTRRSIRGAGLLADTWSLHPLRLLETLLPSPFGDALGRPAELGPWLGPLNDGRSPYFASLYVGVGLLAFAALGALAGRPRRLRAFWGLALLASLAVAFGEHTAGYPAVRELLPPLRALRYPTKHALVATLATAALAACGWDALRACARLRRLRPLRLTAGLGLALAALAAGVSLLLVARPAAAHAAAHALAQAVGLPDPGEGGRFLLGRLAVGAPRLSLLAGGVTLLMWLSATRRPEARWARAALLCVPLLDLAVTNRDLNPALPVSLLAAPEWVAHTRPHATDRVHVPRELLPGEHGADPGLPPPPAYAPSRRVVETVARLTAPLPEFPAAWGVRDTIGEELTGLRPLEFLTLFRLFVGADAEARLRFLVRAGTRYHLAPRPPTPGARRLASLPDVPPMALYEGPEPAPRVEIVPTAQVDADAGRAMARLFAPGGDHELVVEREVAPSGRPGPGVAAHAALLREAREELEVEAGLPEGGGYLLLREGHDPHWTARVDGDSAPVLRANGLFRAVRLQPGTHVVRFSYAPWPYRLGAGVSALTALGLAAAVAAQRVRRGSRP